MKFLTSLFFALISATASAQQVEIVVPFPPGGVVDFVARSIAKELQNENNIQAIVLNRPGADGVIAGRAFLDSKGSQNKILLASGGATLFTKLTKKPNEYFDPINDLDMIGPLATAPTTIAVHVESRFRSFDDFIEIAQKEVVVCGTSNATASFFLQLLAARQQLKLEAVMFKGTADLNNNLIGRHVECGVDALPGYIELVRGGKIKLISLSAKDYSNNVSHPIVDLGEFKFENFFAVALNSNMDSNLRKVLIKFFQDLRNNKDFRQKMSDRGFYMPVVNLKFTSVVQHDYQTLEKARIQLGIEKN
jgi:tripartite-type tricarboxylate transporter receptor subunit TctC